MAWYFVVVLVGLILAGCLAAIVIVGEEKRARRPKHSRPRFFR